MLVENPEVFKAWMTSVLEPLCDADPEALTKYIFALVKKDKSSEELRKSMMSQLEVFLQDETKGFVDLLFEKLETGLQDFDIIQIKTEPLEGEELVTDLEENLLLADGEEISSTGVETAELATPVIMGLELDTESETEKSSTILPESKPVVVVQPSKESVKPDSPSIRNGAFEPPPTLVRPEEQERRLSSSRSQDRKSDTEREERKRRGSSASPRRTERSRSRSWERGRRRSPARGALRCRSRGRERDRSRAWRNKSPPRNRNFDRDRRIRSWSKSPPPRSRSRSPVPRIRSRFRNRSPLNRSRSRSRSHSPYDSPRVSGLSGAVTPTQDSNNGDDARSVNSNLQGTPNKKRRCRDFDEKGFCMRGEMCPYDHGTDPVVLEDVGQVLSFSGPGGQLPPPLEQSVASNPLGVPLLRPTLNMLHRPPPQLPPNLSEYNPDAPSMEPRMWSKQPYRMAGRGLLRGLGVMIRPPVYAPQFPQRELINVPTMPGEEGSFYNPLGNPMKRQCPPDFSNEMMEGLSPIKQRFDYTRLGGRRGNCSLHLRKIPPGLNNIAHLHNHFVKFGKIVNIQVCFEGDLDAALITFTTHAEASAAYKSTEAVLNNRFIKVFWYNSEKDSKQENMTSQIRMSAKDRLGAPVMNTSLTFNSSGSSQSDSSGDTEKVLMSGSNITKTVYIASALEKKNVPKPDPMKLIVAAQIDQDIQLAKEAIKKKQEEKRKEAIKLTQHLCKRKHDLIEKLLLHQKQLIDILEKGNISPEQRVEIMTTIKGFQENIDIIRKDIKTVVGPTKPVNNAVKVTPQLVKKTREETQKQILDAELDLFNQQQEGKDTLELQKKVFELKTKALNLGLLSNTGLIRLSRGASRYHAARGRGGFNPHSTVDHRPTKLLVSGFESDDKAEVLEHFSKFGEVVDHIWDEATPALVIQFKTRKDAETAMAKGRNFQDRLMSVTWFNQAQSMGMRAAGLRNVLLLNENVGDMLEPDEEEEALRINIDTNEDFLLQEDEEEEDEERSWRR